ncbi:MAG: type VI secretion system baseplate subunit TssF [Kiloniellales bacterium]|nr:type VI secretion system baseplate subunit TssF [Kiloniellales bacterium]
MSLNKYFQDELAYLRELGKEFSRANPQLAPFLADKGNDPDVERLLEGFAFLSGRIRQKLDDELPELTHSLISLLWPHYLRPVPSMSILEFEPIASALSGPTRVERGTEVDSVPVEGTACRFQTSYAVDLLPLSITKVEAGKTAGGSALAVTFQLFPGSTLDSLDLRQLRIFLHGETGVSRTLYYWLCRKVRRARVQVGKAGPDGEGFLLPADTVRPVGFAEEEGLLPYPPTSFLGYRLLQEYYSLPEKFMFVDITGLAPLRRSKMADVFTVIFDFDGNLEEQVRPKADNLRLFCTPIVNLFTRDADPIRVDQTKMEYRVWPSAKQPSHYQTYSVDLVEGWIQGTGKRRLYKAFESFEHLAVGGEEEAVFYRTRLHPATVGRGAETYISFVTAGDSATVPPTETISLGITATNRNLAETLRAGDIATATGSSPENARFRNLIPASPSILPPLGGGLHWRLISHLALNYVSLTQLESLRMILSAYDFRSLHDRRLARESKLRLEGLVGVQSGPIDLLYRGLPVRGLRTEIDMRESNFAGEGDLFLFGSVLSEFLSLFASVNSFHQLVVTGVELGEHYEWTAQSGRQQLL